MLSVTRIQSDLAFKRDQSMRCWEEMILQDQPLGRDIRGLKIILIRDLESWNSAKEFHQTTHKPFFWPLYFPMPCPQISIWEWNSRLLHDNAERMDGSCKDNIDLVKERGFACLTNDLSAKSIYSNDITDTGKCRFYTTHPFITWSFSMIFPVCNFFTYVYIHISGSSFRRAVHTSKSSTNT